MELRQCDAGNRKKAEIQRRIAEMFYQKKEITVFLPAEQIAEKLKKLRRKSPFFQKIAEERFIIRVNSNFPSLFRTSVSGFFSGKIIRTEDRNVNRIAYCTWPPLIFWVFFSAWLFLLLSFLVHIFLTFIRGDQVEIRLRMEAVFALLFIEFLTVAEAISQTNMAEERFLKAFAQKMTEPDAKDGALDGSGAGDDGKGVSPQDNEVD